MEPLPARGPRWYHHLVPEPGAAVPHRRAAPAAGDREGQNYLHAESFGSSLPWGARTGARGHLRDRGLAGSHGPIGPCGTPAFHVLPHGVYVHELVLLRPHCAQTRVLAAEGDPPETLAPLVRVHLWPGRRRLHSDHVHYRHMVGTRGLPYVRDPLLLRELEAGGERLGQRDGWHPIPACFDLPGQPRRQRKSHGELEAAGVGPLPHRPGSRAELQPSPRDSAFLLAAPEEQGILHGGLRARGRPHRRARYPQSQSRESHHPKHHEG
mmetsp:Transcript_5389/g.13455  ORF Transcript_5389/g.13455 Transcript_5389/m.13455 type:complete len:267 (-) Transcript_5389:1371-2171(-)